MSRYSSSANRYRGSRGPSGLLLLAALALAALAGWSWLRPALTEEGREPPSARQAAVSTPAEPEAPSEPGPEEAMPPAPGPIRGIYISGPMAGSAHMEELTRLIEDTELNAVVIDVKNDEGKLTYLPEAGTAAELGAGVRYISDLPGLVASLKEKGIYTIARVVAFKDPVLAQARPELALRRTDGTPLTEGGGPAWVNPYEREVWDYLTEIALDAARAGFDEVQFDYVRFPTVKNVDEIDFGPAAQGSTREEAVTGFLTHARSALHAQGVWVSADVFGTVISSQLDAGLIGQSYTGMARAADFICPMVYPSHYAAGAFGLDVPDREPYRTVLTALQQSQTVLSAVAEEERAGVRVWLQGFTASWVPGHIRYGGEELRAQIQAVYDAGCTDWIIWNAQNSYTADGLLPAGASPS